MAVTTRGDLIRHTALELGLDQTVAGEEQLLMIDWADEAVRDVLMETRCTITTATPSLTASLGDYSWATLIGSSFLEILNIQGTYAGNKRKLSRVSIEDILDRRLATAANDVPRYFAAEGDTFLIYPAPGSGVTLTVYYIKQPTAMDTDARDFTTATYGGIPIYAAHAVLQYMLWRGARHDEKRVPHTPAQYRQFYDDELKRVRKRVRRSGGRMLAPMQAGYPDRISGQAFNDRYPDER